MAKTKRTKGAARRKHAPRPATAEDILQLWSASARVGLGRGKKFDQEIFDKYYPPLQQKINENLATGAQFDAKAEQATRRVAHDIGAVCKLLTLKGTVTKDTFDLVFDLMQSHPLCPAPGGGAGGWCNIPIP